MKKTVLFSVVMCGLTGFSSAAIPDAERQVLIALYNSTDGANWTTRDNWRNPGDTDFNDPGTECTWYGITCSPAGDAVHGINLSINNLSGSIPPELGNLSSLWTIRLYINQLTGTIPPNLGSLSNLVQLQLNDNQLEGSIPPELGSLSKLTRLRLDSNQLTGSIPLQLGNLSSLVWLSLEHNQLTGGIPPQLGNLSSLQSLILDRNQLSESIPPELGDLSNLQRLSLEVNQLTGSIPPQLGALSNLELLYLELNQLTGSIPPELGNLSALLSLWLDGNQLTGSIPPEVGNLTNLEWLSLRANHLTGTIPPELGSLSNLEYLDLGVNQLSGSIPTELGGLSNLWWLSLGQNRLNGSIPPELGALTALIEPDGLDLRWNALHSSDGSLIAFLNSKQSGGDWQSTQTIAPLNLDLGAIRDHTVWLSWDAVTYTADPGGYELYYKETTSSQWLLSGATASKATTIFPVTGLDPATQYDFSVKTYTKPHARNQNRVLSDFSSLVTATTADTGSIAPVIRKSGTSPWTLYTTEPFDSYLWSTGESTRIISVDPADTTWYWVTTTAAGSSDESATLVVDPNLPAEVFADGFEGGTTAAWSRSIP